MSKSMTSAALAALILATMLPTGASAQGVGVSVGTDRGSVGVGVGTERSSPGVSVRERTTVREPEERTTVRRRTTVESEPEERAVVRRRTVIESEPEERVTVRRRVRTVESGRVCRVIKKVVRRDGRRRVTRVRICR